MVTAKAAMDHGDRTDKLAMMWYDVVIKFDISMGFCGNISGNFWRSDIHWYIMGISMESSWRFWMGISWGSWYNSPTIATLVPHMVSFCIYDDRRGWGDTLQKWWLNEISHELVWISGNILHGSFKPWLAEKSSRENHWTIQCVMTIIFLCLIHGM